MVFEFCQRGMAIAKANASQRHRVSGVEIFHRTEEAIGEGLANALIGAVHHGVVHAGEKTEERLDVLRAHGAVGDGQQPLRDGGIGGDSVLPSDLIRGQKIGNVPCLQNGKARRDLHRASRRPAEAAPLGALGRRKKA